MMIPDINDVENEEPNRVIIGTGKSPPQGQEIGIENITPLIFKYRRLQVQWLEIKIRENTKTPP